MKLDIGHKLLALREDRKLTQTEMAHLLQVPDATYSRYERNITQVPYNKIIQFAEALSVPIQELLPDTMTVNNSNNTAGQATGSLVLGNQYFYVGDNVVNNSLAQENKELKEKLALLEQQIEELLKK